MNNPEEKEYTHPQVPAYNDIAGTQRNKIRNLIEGVNANVVLQERHQKSVHRRGRNLPTVPTFPVCLMLCCDNIRGCFDYKTQALIRNKTCDKFNKDVNWRTRDNLFPLKQEYKANYSLWEIARIVYALRLLDGYAKVDSRDKHLIEKTVEMTKLFGTKEVKR